MITLWVLNAVAALSIAVYASYHYINKRSASNLYSGLIFLVHGAGAAAIACFPPVKQSAFLLESVWAVMTVLTGIVLALMFYRHFRLLAADWCGYGIEAAFVVMVTGNMAAVGGEYEKLSYVCLLDMLLLAFGFLRFLRGNGKLPAPKTDSSV